MPVKEKRKKRGNYERINKRIGEEVKRKNRNKI
jgi:hypothetical protein